MAEKQIASLTPAEESDLVACAKAGDKTVQKAEVAITEAKCVDGALGFKRPTEIVTESVAEGVRITEKISYVHPPDHKGWAAEAGRTVTIEKIGGK